ncbi:hypothetical protein FACS1894172_12150 [Spirochaetia bacterium]|nr:hypothetical protein FACS1894164_01920 [Spirochaetia bacterium]GHU33503.1 hypothetical protein FACS1894172_12150 [Spirochaetia bacterium]
MNPVIRVAREIVIGWIIKLFTSNDVVRYETLKLVIEEIKQKKILGDTAELGVYKGDFAKKINAHFPDKKLFLFDTFSGFDERDVKTELKMGYNITKTGDFSNSNIELVLKKMKYRENCIVKKGWFPETAEGIDERFSFVSIDADLFEPIYAGLMFFYPLLQKGGYIFVHDYNGKTYAAKEAVQKFSKEFNIPYVPLNDICGSVIFSK